MSLADEVQFMDATAPVCLYLYSFKCSIKSCHLCIRFVSDAMVNDYEDAGLARLPLEVWVKVFSYLSGPDLFRCEAVCTDWRREILHQVVWRLQVRGHEEPCAGGDGEAHAPRPQVCPPADGGRGLPGAQARAVGQRQPHGGQRRPHHRGRGLLAQRTDAGLRYN